ncbi:F420H2 dehydrogenase subunit L [Candidatus Methanoperedens nitroreducens]|uniref:F420H2 dehydrogenase subunit L n=1 Tax=Candidatus Methanoperedens nitratireducens TaxID=1392998 RepID=A0A062V069_9EURY|nr:NADH-quinone oxidoreductase subunit L [Candidatus Methanoperedens nitroreducens]KCZ72536.1 F420H2 dehydrogenase subunit L [Candidatus Methanoperedens nitroreducens]MDJ1423530.1 NADH-quinone oxidoreductase subunit L [Candidatus Methanoperedens sp.]
MFSDYAAAIVLLPVLAFVLTLFLGKKLYSGGAPLPIAAIAGSFIISLGIFFEIYPGGVVQQSWPWFANLNIGILIDPLAVVMLLMVSFVSLLIHIYAVGYMAHDPAKPRYFAETSLFTAAMLAVVLSDNILQFFIAWEIVGVCSFLLIGFWYHKPSAAAAAKKAFLVTRVGDVLFLAGIVLLYVNMSELIAGRALTPESGNFILQFKTMFEAIPYIDSGQLTLITLLFFGGAIGKSGQFPLHGWLPDAMEGPTTVSALIHAATMVTAGVYLVARTFPMFVATPDSLVHGIPDSLLVVAIVGGFTALFAATMGLVMNDIKRVLAYSTVSQLGYMMLALGTAGAVIGAKAVGISMFHLISHAFFKALLFLCAGSVIHAVGTNDIREMGGLFGKMKITAITMLIAALALAGIGIPFINIGTAGFFSKDMIIEGAFEYGEITGGWGWVFYGFAILAALLTSIYIFRLWFMTFTGKPRSERRAHESPNIMTLPLMILAVFALFFGFSQSGFYPYLETNFELMGVEIAGHEGEALHPSAIIIMLPVIVGVLGIVISYMIYHRRMLDMSKIVSSENPLYKLLINRYYEPRLSADIIGVKLTHDVAAQSGEFVDRKIIDGLVIDNIISSTLFQVGEVIRKLQTGVVQNYAAITLLGVGLLILLLKIGGM